MKVRNGFVSNSSSSSFVVAFPRLPLDADDLQQMLFGDEKTLSYYDYTIPTNEAAAIIWNDMFALEKPDATPEEIAEEFYSGWEEDEEEEIKFPNFDPNNREASDRAWEDYIDKCRTKAQKLAKQFIDNNNGANIRIVEYCDNDGQVGCILEHGGTFDRLPHKQINKH